MQDKGELTNSGLWQFLNYFQDSLSSHEGLSKTQETVPFYIDIISKDMDLMAYKVKFVNANCTNQIFEVKIAFELVEDNFGIVPENFAWQELKKEFPDAKLVDKPKDWSEIKWSSPFYKKQNEMAIKALFTGDSPTTMDFPMYAICTNELVAKKKIHKNPIAKPGDDWWIKL